MRDPGNIDAVCASGPDYVGFIFYPRSKRYVGEMPDPAIFDRVPAGIGKVGVFVNEKPETVIGICTRYGLEAAQLHGNETPADCRAVRHAGLTVFKAFSVGNDFDFAQLQDYLAVTDFFLFDTKGKLPGGTGEKFNWQILEQYPFEKPFFLSGGIGPADCAELKRLGFDRLFALDLNSGFETEPALKDAAQVAGFIRTMKN